MVLGDCSLACQTSFQGKGRKLVDSIRVVSRPAERFSGFSWQSPPSRVDCFCIRKSRRRDLLLSQLLISKLKFHASPVAVVEVQVEATVSIF